MNSWTKLGLITLAVSFVLMSISYIPQKISNTIIPINTFGTLSLWTLFCSLVLIEIGRNSNKNTTLLSRIISFFFPLIIIASFGLALFYSFFTSIL